ncbi:MAG TPA: hypothetical protein VM580_08160 [Labilithrix sp.]|jgi:hypothetical protein|nr:hypothetical protein [Labilithrix sp.]
MAAVEGTEEVGKEAEKITPEEVIEEKAVGSPISNEAYNVITALQAKLEGLEAYRKYAKDADVELWRELTMVECKAVERLVCELEKIVKEGRLSMKEPGHAH